MAFHLRKIIQVTAFAMAFVLVALLGLGIRQYQLYTSHAQVTGQTEKLLFQFAIIREHVTETLLEENHDGLSGVAGELEALNLNLSEILHNRNIDDQYKLSFANTIDLPGLILLVRKIVAGPAKPESLRQLNSEIRTLGERLVLFDRVLVENAKRQLIGFQNIVIGALALVVSLVIAFLLFFQKKLIVPLLDLVAQVREVAAGTRSRLSIPGRNSEISDLAYSVHDILTEHEATAHGLEKLERVAAAVKRAQQAIAKSRDADAMFKDVCRALLVNHDYCLVWIGKPNASGDDVLPVSADGSTSMTSKECETCVALLLTEAEEKGLEYNPAAMALRAEKPVVKRDILAEVPRGLLKGTPLSGGHAACAAFPIIRQNIVYGVISVYAASQTGFDEKEVELLDGLAADMAFVLHALMEQQRLVLEEDLHRRMLSALGGVRLRLTSSGRLLEANEVFLNVAGIVSEKAVGHMLVEFFRSTGEESPAGSSFWEQLLEERQGELLLLTDSAPQRMRYSLFSCPDAGGDGEGWILMALPVLRTEPQGMPGDCPRLKMIAEMASGVSHEISDLSNGLINYAQVLADEEGSRFPGKPQNEMLIKIIDGGERIAEMVGKLIFYGQEQDIAGEFLSVSAVLEDLLLLCGYHLKSDGIQLEVRLEAAAPVVPVRAQEMQQVFLWLLNIVRSSLNDKFRGRDARKKIAVESRTMPGNNHSREFQVSITDCAASLPLNFPERESGGGHGGAAAALAACRRTVENQGGTLALLGEEGKFTSIVIRLPVKGD